MKRDPRATSVPAKLFYRLGPSAFLELAQGRSRESLVREHGSHSATWLSWITKAREELNLPREYEGEDTTAVTPPSDIVTEFETATGRRRGKARRPPPETRAIAEMEMRRVDEPDRAIAAEETGRLPANAREEYVPREWEGGLRGGEALHPGEQATAQQIAEYYLNATDVEEHVHRVRLRVAPGKEYARLIPFSDVHICERDCDFARWWALCDWVAEHEGTYMVGLGDYLQANIIGSVRQYRQGEQLLSLGEGWNAMAVTLERVAAKGRLLALGVGNHEEDIRRRTGEADLCPARRLAELLNVPYALYDFPLVCDVGDQRYTLYLHHGTGSGSTWGAVWNQIHRLSENADCDAVVMAHRHVLGVQERAKMGVAEREDGSLVWEPRKLPMVSAGCYQRYHPGGYARQRNLPPAVLGTPTMQLYASRHHIHHRV